MRRPRWLWILAGLMLSGMLGCKCGEKDEKTEEPGGGPQAGGSAYESTVSKLPGARQVDVAAVVPGEASVVIVAPNLDGLLGWLDGKSWFQEVKKSPVFQDMRFAGTWFQLSTIKHRIESLSAVRFERTKMKEILSTPMALAFHPGQKGTKVLVVKQIDLKVQALDRLVEVLNQINPRQGMLSTREVEGLQLRDLRLDGNRHLYYLLFSNLLLMSNDEGFLVQSTKLARGESSESVVADPAMKRLLAGAEGYALVAAVNLERMRESKQPGLVSSLLPVKQIALRLSSGNGGRLDVESLVDSGGQLNATYGGASILPLDSRLVVGLARLDLQGLWRLVESRVDDADILPGKVKNSIRSKLLAGLDPQALVVLGGVDLQGKRPVPEAGLLLKIKEGQAGEAAAGALKFFSFLFGEEPRLKKLKQASDKKIRVMKSNRAFSPAFAVVDGWLVLCTTETLLRKIVATSLGQEPALKDVPGFAEKVIGEARPFFSLSYVDCGLLFEDMKAYSQALLKRGNRFDAATLGETVTPLLDALKKIGKLGGAISQGEKGITGSVVPL